MTLESVRAYTSPSCELILLPDGADEPTCDLLRELQHLRQLPSSPSRGVASCFNRLVSGEKADVFVLLESGCQVGCKWLGLLLDGLSADARNGLAGPSTNRSWNIQAAFPNRSDSPREVATTSTKAFRRFGVATRTLEPLYSLADFCYAVRREVIEDVGLADEGYGLGPCWEMDYNIRAARAGWRGVWVCGAYVHRMPFHRTTRVDEARFFEASKRRYQDKFCGASLAR